MPVLVDTGILLKLTNRHDPRHTIARSALRAIRNRSEEAFTTLQNISEFWNVSTRPASARGGLGITVAQSEKRLRLLERILTILPEPAGLYSRWRQIVLSHRVMGVQVHDAKLVAAMTLHGIDQILTFNDRDFSRYSDVKVINPSNLPPQ